MALDTYAELRTEVAAWLHRNDLTSRIPTFIEFATNRLSRSITSPRMEASTTLTVTNGTASLPSDFRAAISMTLGTVEYKAITAADMRAMNQGGIRPTYPVYSIVNNQITVYPAESSSPTFIYATRLANLVTDADTNWVLQDYPDVYLMASLAEARKFVLDDTRLVQYEQMTIARIAELNRNELRNIENTATWYKQRELPVHLPAYDIRFG
jgi:hypothetical protein